MRPFIVLAFLLVSTVAADADDSVRLKCQISECHYLPADRRIPPTSCAPEAPFEVVLNATAKKVHVWGVELTLVVEEEAMKWTKSDPKNPNIYKYAVLSRNTLDISINEYPRGVGRDSTLSKGSCTKVERQL